MRYLTVGRSGVSGPSIDGPIFGSWEKYVAQGRLPSDGNIRQIELLSVIRSHHQNFCCNCRSSASLRALPNQDPSNDLVYRSSNPSETYADVFALQRMTGLS